MSDHPYNETECMRETIKQQDKRIAELEAENAEQRKRLNQYAGEIGTGSQCKKCGRFYLHREGCKPCKIAEIEAENARLQEDLERLEWLVQQEAYVECGASGYRLEFPFGEAGERLPDWRDAIDAIRLRRPKSP